MSETIIRTEGLGVPLSLRAATGPCQGNILDIRLRRIYIFVKFCFERSDGATSA